MLTLLLLYAALLLAWAAFPLRDGVAFVSGLLADDGEPAEASSPVQG